MHAAGEKFAVHLADQNCVCYTAKGACFTVTTVGKSLGNYDTYVNI